MIEDQEEKGPDARSRSHDLFTAVLGGFAAFLLATLKHQIETRASPYPFYKGPVIFPLFVLSVMVLASAPSFYRLLRPAPESSWRIDGEGWPRRPAAIVALLVLFFIFGIPLIGIEMSVLSFLSISIFFLGYRSRWINIALPLLYTAGLVSVFKYMFGVWFPKPLILRLLGG